MLVQKDFLSKLRDFGLNTYESKIWTALLSRGVSTAGELSDIANVPRSRSYDVLESLERKGFIIMKLGKPITYLAVPPHEVVERIKQKLQEESNSRLELLEHIKSTKLLDELNSLHEKGSQLIAPTDMTGSLRGRGNVYNQLVTMIKQAKKRITIATTASGLTRKADVLMPHLEKAKQRGVTITFAGDFGSNTEPYKKLAAVGSLVPIKARTRFCIVDGKEVLFLLMDDDKVHPSYEVAVWVKTEYFASLLDSAFASYVGR